MEAMRHIQKCQMRHRLPSFIQLPAIRHSHWKICTSWHQSPTFADMKDKRIGEDSNLLSRHLSAAPAANATINPFT